ncbi:geranylgeranyl diphosphate synthase type I [Crossiella equi]|uniref:Geranylgeranyl diphosphate synthase type I n=1 Tax=Crossiella equi TaxID=130796 RepID=A0ABS5ARM4_9PSEU|nr:polyprenyl synthetase family protein [Crossiella equi]MBP2479210.1 geranylgeranyl diphosphate synthase type I [Crossiella equi]
MTLTGNAAPEAADVLHRSGLAIDGPLRAAVGGLAASLRLGAGFHFGFWDAQGNPITADQGKMARPAFVLGAARAVGGGRTGDAAVRAAVAVELVHNFSLVHDDVMDADRTRRGRATVWAQFGVPYAILLGDAMLAMANQVLTRGGDADAVAVCAELSAAVVALCVGQHQDMSFEEQGAVGPEEYLAMAAGKTAALLAGACVLGALAGGASPAQVDALRRFGHHIGLAFQLVDDVLGIFGDPAVTGKPVGADLLRYKKSMPVLVALTGGSPAGAQLAELYRTRAVTPENLAHAADLVAEAGGRSWTEHEAARQYRLALHWLDQVDGDPVAVAELRALADLMTTRNR